MKIALWEVFMMVTFSQSNAVVVQSSGSGSGSGSGLITPTKISPYAACPTFDNWMSKECIGPGPGPEPLAVVRRGLEGKPGPLWANTFQSRCGKVPDAGTMIDFCKEYETLSACNTDKVINVVVQLGELCKSFLEIGSGSGPIGSGPGTPFADCPIFEKWMLNECREGPNDKKRRNLLPIGFGSFIDVCGKFPKTEDLAKICTEYNTVSACGSNEFVNKQMNFGSLCSGPGSGPIGPVGPIGPIDPIGPIRSVTPFADCPKLEKWMLSECDGPERRNLEELKIIDKPGTESSFFLEACGKVPDPKTIASFCTEYNTVSACGSNEFVNLRMKFGSLCSKKKKLSVRGPKQARNRLNEVFSTGAVDSNGCSSFLKEVESLNSKCFKFKKLSYIRKQGNSDASGSDASSSAIEVEESTGSQRQANKQRVELESTNAPTQQDKKSIRQKFAQEFETTEDNVELTVEEINIVGSRRRLSSTTYRVLVDISTGCGDDMVPGPIGVYCYPQYVSAFRRYVESVGAAAHSSHEYGSYLVLNSDAKSWSSFRPSQKSARNGVDYIFDLQFGYRKNGKKCPEGYMGSTCAERVCAYGLSSSTSGFLQQGDGVHTPDSLSVGSEGHRGGTHSYTECSSQGVCDRITGQCSCFAGYQGKGCRRTTCPNDCSGHGRCLTNRDINGQYVGTASSSEVSASFSTQFWDHDKTLQCACDRGYTGHDCSSRICPHGDDVLTSCSEQSVHDLQTIVLEDVRTAQSNAKKVTSGACVSQDPTSGLTNAPFFFLTFADHLGGTYTTKPIQAQVSSYVGGDVLYAEANKMPTHAAATAAAVQAALEALPNHAIPSVQVRGTTETLSGVVAQSDNDGLPVVQVIDPSSQSTVNIPQYSRVANTANADPGFDDCVYKHLKLTVKFVDDANAGKQNTLQCSLPSPATNCESGMQPAMPLSSQQNDAEAGNDVQIKCVVEDIAGGPNGDLPHGGTHEENAECGNRGLCDTSTGKCNCFAGHTGEACGVQSNYV